MIQIANLSVDFGGVRAVNEVTVILDQQIVGVIGSNGAGKTTVLNVLSGFVKPTSGSVLNTTFFRGFVLSQTEEYQTLGRRTTGPLRSRRSS